MGLPALVDCDYPKGEGIILVVVMDEEQYKVARHLGKCSRGVVAIGIRKLLPNFIELVLACDRNLDGSWLIPLGPTP